jgi:hypothetical protein
VKRVAWGALFAAGVIGFELALFRLNDIGTCASGGPYVIGDECPSGTNAWVAALIGSILAMLGAGLGFGSIGPDSGPGDRGWIPALALIPGMREFALLGLLTAAIALVLGEWALAAVMVVIGPGSWLVGRGLARLARTGPAR